VTRAIVFDRDATIIDVVRDEEAGVLSVAFHPDQLRFLPGVIDGMRALQDAGFLLAIATNQPGPAKGQFSVEAVRRTNEALLTRLSEAGIRISALEVCMHHPDGGPGGDSSLVLSCDCRKPKPGMLRALLATLRADASRSWMIGDSSGDIEAGQACGMATGLVVSNRCELCPWRVTPLKAQPSATAATISELAQFILARA
jgi:D-glycero-D-manno-heptose 1,7-bisphosphate phosphatase